MVVGYHVIELDLSAYSVIRTIVSVMKLQSIHRTEMLKQARASLYRPEARIDPDVLNFDPTATHMQDSVSEKPSKTRFRNSSHTCRLLSRTISHIVAEYWQCVKFLK